jgi:hypothetical protein
MLLYSIVSLVVEGNFAYMSCTKSFIIQGFVGLFHYVYVLNL